MLFQRFNAAALFVACIVFFILPGAVSIHLTRFASFSKLSGFLTGLVDRVRLVILLPVRVLPAQDLDASDGLLALSLATEGHRVTLNTIKSF